MKQKLLLLLLSFFALTASAEKISVEVAKKMAMEFFKNNRPQLSVKNLKMVYDAETPASRANGEDPALYVFDNPQGKGFVIVSGDDLAQPILGYSYENEFPTEDIPSHVEGWLESLKKQINDGRKYGVISTPSSRSISRAGTPVVKLETAQWNQGTPYNTYCPKINGELAPTGCGITATAIIMKYHGWPQKGVGTIPGYTTESQEINMPAIELGHEYQWDNMPLSYTKNYTTEQADQVARLMADLGTLLEADYDKGGTGAYATKFPSKLIKYMDYDNSASYLMRTAFSNAEWHNLMKSELGQRRPILYNGCANDEGEGGHAFVLDGYTTDGFYSVNWGWGGYCNGYFLLEALIPEGTGIGGNNENYNFIQSAIVSLQPNAGGEYANHFKFIYDGGLYTDVIDFERNKTFTLEVRKLYSFCGAAVNPFFQLAVVNKDNEIKEILEDFEEDTIGPLQGYSSMETEVKITGPIEVGDRIRFYFKTDKDDEWTVVKGGEDSAWELLLADESTLAQQTSVEFDRNTQMLKIKTKSNVTVKWTNEDGQDLTDSCELEGNQIIISTENLPASTYILHLTRGDENLSVRIKLGESQE